MAAFTHAEIHAHLKTLIKLLNEYRWLTDSYMLDFFTLDHINKLPLSWKALSKNIKVEDFGRFLNWNLPLSTSVVWPLSLLAIRQIIKSHCLPRDRESQPYSCIDYKVEETNPLRTPCFQHVRLKNLFLKHVKPKKRYEIEKMTSLTAKLANKLGVKWVIDIGSGLGHLSRTLAYGYGLQVICVEAQAELSTRAYALDRELEVTASKHLTEEDMVYIKQCRPHHRREIISFDSTEETLKQMITECSGGEDQDFGIIGLHPCGDLAAILLSFFINCPRAAFINVVGCCYHKMTLKGSTRVGFPVSRTMAQNNSDLLSAEAAALGCHAIEAYSVRLSTGDYEHLKVHCFRAALERIIAKRWPEHARCGLNNVRHYPDLSFTEYCEKALKKLKLNVPQDELNSRQTLEDLSRWKDAVFYHSLWLMLGPAVETVTLLDRLLYLIENNIPCQLQAAFDPIVSPRNHVLSAMKLR